MPQLFVMAPCNRFSAMVLVLLSVLPLVVHAKTEYTYGTDANGVTQALAYDRTPALYTGDFGDCLGGQSLFNITKFDAAYYADNLTIVMHLDGASNIKNESLMMHISVDAYGSERFQMSFDPCFVNLYSLCPLNASVPITGWATFPVGPAQIGGIPAMAFSIPDFEGTAKLRIFANSSETEIGCFQAGMRNGKTFSHPEIVAPVLGGFTLIAIIASFATAAYGVSVVHMRMHHAHSLSVLVLFETLQSIFFTGALTVNWPSVCVAWWNNFAWSAGVISAPALVRSVNSFAGVAGNASQVGGAGSVVLNTGGGLISQIYGRSLSWTPTQVIENTHTITRRAPYNASNPFDYTWAGKPMMPGMPLPGTWIGLPGTLAGSDIPAKDAFIISLIWIMVAISSTTMSIAALKGSLEVLARTKRIKPDRLAYFRSHWPGYMVQASLRAFFMAFFVVMVLAMYQFTLRVSTGAAAITATTFVLFLISAMLLIGVACYARTRHGKFERAPDQIIFHRSTFLGVFPILIPAWASTLKEHELEVRPVVTFSMRRIRHINTDPTMESVHKDQGYVKRFGWFSARYRRTRWWFLAYYAVYLVGRAGFLGAGALSPLAQVYGLLLFEIAAFLIIIILNPFEGARNTALAVWMLSISKIATTGLSIAFLPAFKLDRIIATVVGYIIIIIQGLLVIGLMILIALSALSTWMSLTRNREELGAEHLENTRVKYFENMEARALDTYRPPKQKKSRKGKGKDEEEPPVPTPEPKFSVVSVRRAPKIEDEDEDDNNDVLHDLKSANNGTNGNDPSKPSTGVRGAARIGRTNSVSSQHSVNSLPRGLRSHQAWSSTDGQYDEALDRPDSSLAQRLGEANGVGESSRSNTPAGGGVKRISSRQSLRTLSGRPNSPFSPGLNTPSRETLARHAEERRYPTPQPTIPDLE